MSWGKESRARDIRDDGNVLHVHSREEKAVQAFLDDAKWTERSSEPSVFLAQVLPCSVHRRESVRDFCPSSDGQLKCFSGGEQPGMRFISIPVSEALGESIVKVVALEMRVDYDRLCFVQVCGLRRSRYTGVVDRSADFSYDIVQDGTLESSQIQCEVMSRDRLFDKQTVSSVYGGVGSEAVGDWRVAVDGGPWQKFQGVCQLDWRRRGLGTSTVEMAVSFPGPTRGDCFYDVVIGVSGREQIRYPYVPTFDAAVGEIKMCVKHS